MPVSMAKTQQSAAATGHKGTTSGTPSSSSGTKVPFKKVFSSSHLQTNGVNSAALEAHKHRPSNDFGSALTHPSLTSQLSSSLPGFLDNVNGSGNGGQPGKVLVPGSASGASSRRSSQTRNVLLVNSSNSTSPSTVIPANIKVSTSSTSTSMNGIPFSAIDPSLLVSLGTCLKALKHFDAEKLIKEIHLMLTYFEDVVKKDKLEQLVGACTILMDTVDANCVKLRTTYRQLQQVQVGLHVLLQSLDAGDAGERIHRSPVIEATNELYRKMAELLQWSDQVSTLHRLIEDGDRRMVNGGGVVAIIDGSPSPERDAASMAVTFSEKESESREEATKSNVKMAHDVSRNLLDAFENLVKAYKNMEEELRLCYEEYSRGNKQMVELILSETSSSSGNRLPLHTIRRRSITPPPDYPLGTSGNGTVSRIPNGSTSTIASSASASSASSSNTTNSSNSSGTSHFLGVRNKFFPNLTNHAQKMAHKMLSKGKSGKTGDSASPKGDGSPADKPHSWSLWPKLSASASLRRSESASDISSLQPRASYLDIPEENHGGGGGGGKGGARNRSPSPFRKHSINEQIMNSVTGGSGSSASSTNASDLMGVRKSSINRHSDGDSVSSSTLPPFQGSIPVKDMLVNPLYFTPAQVGKSNSGNSPTTSDIKIGVGQQQQSPVSRTSPNSSPGSTHSKYSSNFSSSTVPRNDSSTVATTKLQSPGQSEAASVVDRPPPLPPKTYQTSRSMSSTRSSIASNTSSSSATSLQSKSDRPGGQATTDTDSGLGTMPTSSISSNDLEQQSRSNGNAGTVQCTIHCNGSNCNIHKVSPVVVVAANSNSSSCDHRRAICTQPHQPPVITTCIHHSGPSCQHAQQQHVPCNCHINVQPCNHSGVDQMDTDHSPPNTAVSQQMGVTLRPKKNRGRAAHKCDYNCERAPDSPPPLPPPDSIIFSLDTVVPLDGGVSGVNMSMGNFDTSHHHPITSPPGTITTGHCCQCHRRGGGGSVFDERNKENFNFTNINTTCGSCTCQTPQNSPPPCQVGGTCCAHANVEQPMSTTVCPQHGCPTCRRHPTTAANLQRSYRRERTMHNHQHQHQHHHQTVQFSKSMRSYSIAETSSATLKSSSSSLTVDCSGTMTHSSSFPHRLSSCDSSLPPPLPPKKRNMNAYMLVVGNYSGPSDVTADFYRFSAANFTKSMIETTTMKTLTTKTNSMITNQSSNRSIRQNSTASSASSSLSSAMSLSSSSSSSLHSCCNTTACSANSTSTNTTSTTAAVDHLDMQQYAHLPMAPPPPLPPSLPPPPPVLVNSPESTSPDRKLAIPLHPPPPPRLPPRRDKLNDLPLAPPPPPPVSSSSVLQQRQQQLKELQNTVASTDQSPSPSSSSSSSSATMTTISPRSSTPLKPAQEICVTRTCSCHGTTAINLESDLAVEDFTSSAKVDESKFTEDIPMEVEEEMEVVVEEDEQEGSSTPPPVPSTPQNCTVCSDRSVKHSEAECILSQTDVPARLLTYRSKDDDEDLGDLAIRAGTVDGLLVKATQASVTGADATFLHTFLNTYRSFISPASLIDKLIFRYNQFSNSSTERTDAIRQAVASKVVTFIVLVVNEFYLYDFSKAVSYRLMEFIYQLVGRGDLAHAKCLREKCYEKLRQRDREFAAAAANSPGKLTSYSITTRTSTLLDFKSEHIAEQMTLLDSRLFHKIEIPEILIWAKEQKEELIPNLNRFTEHFNKMSFWARSVILACEDQKERERIVLKFLKIMKCLKKLNNFNSYLSLLAALASAPISRLEWPKNIQETFNEYNALIDSSSSFRTYRTVLTNTKPPCIPYIGLILQDLTFVHIGNSDYLPDGKVNFAKHFKQFSILSQMKQFQQCKYTITENENIISFFDNFDNYLQEDVMWQISESIKPRGGGGANSTANMAVGTS